MEKRTLSVRNELLKKHISDYYIIEIESEMKEPILVPPLGFPVLHFHYGEPGDFYNYKNTGNESVFIGQITRHIILKPHKGLRLLGVNFKPYGLYNLLGIKPKQITDGCIESKYFWDEEIVDKIRQELAASSDTQKVDIIENLLVPYILQPDTSSNFIYDGMVDEIIQKNGLLNIGNIVNGKISTRTLERYFDKVIGISPKLFCQILRHKLIVQLTYEQQKFDWQDAIFLGYYHDHSHLTKDFEKFSNLKPVQYLRVKNQYSKEILNKA
ncbi:MAG: helix-turn-helix domain-containing protein [Paludibacter sp.]|nr:helix-turn-helix domain-containing protein [Paludibacter sp.]